MPTDRPEPDARCKPPGLACQQARHPAQPTSKLQPRNKSPPQNVSRPLSLRPQTVSPSALKQSFLKRRATFNSTLFIYRDSDRGAKGVGDRLPVLVGVTKDRDRTVFLQRRTTDDDCGVCLFHARAAQIRSSRRSTFWDEGKLVLKRLSLGDRHFNTSERTIRRRGKRELFEAIRVGYWEIGGRWQRRCAR